MSDRKNKKLCKIIKKLDVKDNLRVIKEVVKDPKYICRKCARASKKEDNLCKPVNL